MAMMRVWQPSCQCYIPIQLVLSQKSILWTFGTVFRLLLKHLEDSGTFGLMRDNLPLSHVSWTAPLEKHRYLSIHCQLNYHYPYFRSLLTTCPPFSEISYHRASSTAKKVLATSLFLVPWQFQKSTPRYQSAFNFSRTKRTFLHIVCCSFAWGNQITPTVQGYDLLKGACKNPCTDFIDNDIR